MVKVNKKKRKEKFCSKSCQILDILFLGSMGLVFLFYGMKGLITKKITVSGSYGRGVGWEAEGVAAFGISICILIMGFIFIYYLIDKFK